MGFVGHKLESQHPETQKRISDVKSNPMLMSKVQALNSAAFDIYNPNKFQNIMNDSQLIFEEAKSVMVDTEFLKNNN